MVSLTTVRKIQREPDDKFIPEVDMFPWRGWCNTCPWRVTTGAWRDTYDMAFYHAKGGVHIVPMEDTQYVVLPSGSPQGAIAYPEDNPMGDSSDSGGNLVTSLPARGPLRTDQLVEEEEDDFYDMGTT